MRVYRNYEAVKEAAVIAWGAVHLVPELVRSVEAASVDPPTNLNTGLRMRSLDRCEPR
jgi:hypothetical protein